jgi:mono/diheme cytochrome c family protein
MKPNTGTYFAAVAMLAVLVSAVNLTAQTEKKTAATGDAVARGKYLVEGVAMCGTCHTPRKANGELDRDRWLAGAPVPYMPPQPRPNWPSIAPRIAGLPPTSNAGMVTLLTTGIWIDGKPLRDPMPRFQMTQADAQAVLAYLKSLGPGK